MNKLERQKSNRETLRKLALSKLGGKCVLCGATKNLHIHHKDRDATNDDEANLQLLCEKCHGKEHGLIYNSEHDFSGEYVRVNLYVLDTLWREFKDICHREGESMSRKISRYLNQYNQAHAPGNPQLKMSNYVSSVEIQPMRVMCGFIDGALSDGQVHCRRSASWLPGVSCYSCEKNQLRKTKEK